MLRKRVDTETVMDEKIVQPNTDATGVELHKDSKFYQQWQNFKDNNQYVNKVITLYYNIVLISINAFHLINCLS